MTTTTADLIFRDPIGTWAKVRPQNRSVHIVHRRYGFWYGFFVFFAVCLAVEVWLAAATIYWSFIAVRALAKHAKEHEWGERIKFWWETRHEEEE